MRGATLLFLVPTLVACEAPRDRACRALVIQTRNAAIARTAATPDPRLAAHRAGSAARWLRSNAVEDATLKQEAADLADALDRLSDARLRLAGASEVLGATDSTDLLARAERVIAYAADIDKPSALRMRPCEDDPHAVAISTACIMAMFPIDCRSKHVGMTLAAQAERCVKTLEAGASRAAAPSEAHDLASTMRATADWAKVLPPRDLDETITHARAVPGAIADRGRADADVTRLVASLAAKCGS